MKKTLFFAWPKRTTRFILLLAIFSFSLGTVGSVSASTASSQDTCGQLLADAKARFLKTLAPDGSVPTSPETKAAAQEYIRVSKQCYDQMDTGNQTGSLQAGTPTVIDDGGLLFNNSNPSSAEFLSANTKWGSPTPGTPGGTVSYSFMGNGVNLSAENAGSSVAISSLPGFQPCFITEIQNAFAAWQAVSNIKFVQVNDNGVPFNASGATGDIRIGAHAFDGPSGTLAHTYYPPPNGLSAAGDMHFDSAETWTCNTSGVDIGIVALHEIGHAIGLAHENTSTVAVMNPIYNPSVTSLQPDDINGVISIYGAAAITAAAPPNDNITSPTPIISIPFSEIVDTTGAANVGDGPPTPPAQVLCDGGLINKGTKNIWYTYSPAGTVKASFDSFGSTVPGGGAYDTYIAVWTGPNVNNLSLVGCSDDTASTFQSQLVLKLNGGQTYYIEIAQYNGYSVGSEVTPTGGTLHFRALAVGGPDTVGVFRPSNGALYLKNTNATGFADIQINYGQAGDYPVTGDWDGNGTDTIGIYRNGSFYLRNANTIGFADLTFPFGAPGDQPIAGDWNGDGVDTIGVYRSSTGTFYLRNSNTAGAPDYVFQLGIPGDVGIAGDWTGKGFDTTGVFRPSNGALYLKNSNTTGFADIQINYGIAGDKPVTGDWNADGKDTIGVYRNGTFYLRNSNDIGFANIVFALGVSGDMPIAGNWDGAP